MAGESTADIPINSRDFLGRTICLVITIYFLGNYSVYGFEIKLTRSIGPFILSVYLPSAMFVTMSWVSFVIPPVRFSLRFR